MTTNEIKTFLGVLLLMGIVYKPKMRMYWSKDALYSTPLFSEVMSPDRFELIMKFFHFNDNSTYNPTEENRDSLHKVQPLIEALHERCQKVYYPGQNLSVDEMLVLFKGRLHFKLFIGTKRARFGIKLYELCTSSGIALDFPVYYQKGMFRDDDPYYDMPSSERIPFDLFSGKGMHYTPIITIQAHHWENFYWKIKHIYVEQSAATDRIIERNW